MRALAFAFFALTAAAQTQYETPVWSPDARSIAFVAMPKGGAWNIYRVALDGSHRVQLTTQGAWDPAWAPDGSAIAFVSTIDGKRQISMMSPEGAGVRQLTHGPYEAFHPAWSPDSKRIAFASGLSGGTSIFVMNADGSAAKAVTPPDRHARWPAWSPDASRIAYYVEATANSIWIADLASGKETKLFDSGLTRTLIDWSPDGKSLVFTRGAGSGLGIDVLEIATGSVGRVVGNELRPGEPRWSPDGKKVLFSTHNPGGVATFVFADRKITQVLN